MLFNHIAIVGVGLIGGSFALAARRAGVARRVTGCGGSSLADAVSSGIVEAIETSFDEGRVSEADLIYLAAPVRAIIEFLSAKGELIKPGAIVTDAGSTKREICRAAREGLPPGVHFVGGHPIAGSHKTGARHASADLFRNAPYAIIAGEGEAAESDLPYAVAKMVETVSAMGARPVIIPDWLHDRIIARTSHAPQLLSTALALAVAGSDSGARIDLSGSGLAGMIRLAASRWSVWEDICRTNADEIARALDEVVAAASMLREALGGKDFSKIGDAFNMANEFAERLNGSKAE